MPKRIAFALAAAALVALVTLGLVEAALRVYAANARTDLAKALEQDPYAILVEPHGEGGFRPRANATFRYANGMVAHVNDMGFRGPTVTVPKPAETLRVILLGGSTTFGWGVDDDETIDAYMREMLAERLPDRTVEVVNLGFDGYDSYQLYQRFLSDGVRLEPDIVIINSGVNDAHNAWFREIADGDPRSLLYRATLEQLRHEAARGGPTLWTRTKHWLYAARLPGWLRGRLRRALAPDGPPPPYYWDALDYFERNLTRLSELAEQGSAVVLYSTPPSSLLTLYEPGEPPRASYWIHDAATTQVYRDSLQARIRGLAEARAAEGKPGGYVAHEPFPGAVFLDDAHLTPEGNRRMAADFTEAVLRVLDAAEGG